MKNILNILNHTLQSDEFAFFNKQDAFFPDIHIKSLKETIALPLAKPQAKDLIRVSNQAPYGKGEKTLVDKKIRNCWEVQQKDIVISNKKWAKLIQKNLRDVETYFDMQPNCLEADLYKLLVYEKGCFFTSHKDSEKTENMIMTMVIVLPSKHRGGELVIRHNGQEVTFNSSKEENINTFQSFIFYTDCQHELKKLTSGYRLCLTYNIKYKKEYKSYFKTENPKQIVDTIAKEFLTWKETKNRNSKLVFTLNHQYSQKNFKFKNLKGKDRTNASLLLQAGQQANFDAYLGLVEHYKCYDAYEDYDPYHYRSSRTCDNDIELGELIDEYLILSNLQDKSGKFINKSYSISLDEIVATNDWDDFEAFEEEYEPPTGNAGSTQSYWYNYAGIVLAPKEDAFRISLESDLSSAICHAWELCQRNKSVDQEKVKLIIQYIDKKSNSRSLFRENEALEQLFECLVKLGDKSYLEKFVFNYAVIHEYEWSKKNLKILVDMFSETVFHNLIQKIIESDSYQAFYRILNIIEQMPVSILKKDTRIFDSILKVYTENWRYQSNDQLLSMIKLASRMNAAKFIKPIFEFMEKKNSTRNQSDTENIKMGKSIIKILKTNNASIKTVAARWLKNNQSVLKKKCKTEPESAYKPKIPKLPSKTSKEAKQLLTFMKNASQEKIEFRFKKLDRLELEKVIRECNIDVDTIAKTNTRPQTLICIKKGAGQRMKIKEYQDNQKLIKEYESLIKALK